MCFSSLDQAKKEATLPAKMRTPHKKKRRVELSMDKDKKNGQDFSGAEAAIRNLVASIPGVQKLIDTVPGADTTVKSIVSGIPGAASLFDKVSSPQRNLKFNASKLTSTTKYNFRVERNVGGISGLHIAYVFLFIQYKKTHGNTHTHTHTHKQIRRLHRGSGTKTLSSSELISLDRRTSSTIWGTLNRSKSLPGRSSSCHQRCERQWIVSRFHYSRLLFQLDIHTGCILCSTSRLSDEMGNVNSGCVFGSRSGHAIFENGQAERKRKRCDRYFN